MDGLFGDGLVDVLCCGGDSLEEDLRWGPRLGKQAKQEFSPKGRG